jgi:molybdopterin converting factor small subunit
VSKVIFFGPLVQAFNSKEIEVKGEDVLQALKNIDKKGIILDLDNNTIRPGYIILINGVDWRIKGGKITDNDIIQIIPINHGG